ncbi:alpha/beta hydrolase fold domain-containing protein [Nonomuraea africana]|uniref:alpha/beta hydrolase fold domain-containing protein n=1 Tax=Nonomuraea africana TaxID=46171 RepID=UPI003F4D62EA
MKEARGAARRDDDLSRRAGHLRVAVVFVNYSLSPEARYPVAIGENYAAAQWVVRHGAEHGLDPSRIAVAGDSVGRSPPCGPRRRCSPIPPTSTAPCR